MTQPSNSSFIPFNASAPVPVGKRAEPRVTQSVVRLLEGAGHSVEALPFRDDRGEDAKLRVGSRSLTLQTTGIPQAPAFWGEVAAKGSATTEGNVERIAQWLKDGIAAKVAVTSPAERPNTIVALDAHDWAEDVINPNVIAALNARGLNPAVSNDLAGVAIVGRHSSAGTWIPGRVP